MAKDLTTNLRSFLNPRKKRFWGLLLVLVYTLAGFFLMPWLIKDQLPGIAQSVAGRTASVSEVHFNPWSLQLDATELQLLDENDGSFVQIDNVRVNLQLSSIFYRAFSFREITLNKPFVRIARYADGDSNIALLIDDLTTETEPQANPPPEDSDLPRVVIQKLAIQNGLIDFLDAVPEEDFQAKLTPINIEINNLSTLPDDAGDQAISITLDGGSRLDLNGNVQLNPLLAQGSIELVGSPIPAAQRYLDDTLGFTLRNSGFSAGLDFAVTETANQSISATVSDLSLQLQEVIATSKKDDSQIIAVPALRVSGGSVKWPEQTISIANIELDNPSISINRNADGSLNLDELIPAETTPKSQSAAPSQSTPVEKENAEALVLADSAEPTELDWQIDIAAFRINSMATTFIDRTLKEPGQLELTSLNLLVENLSTVPDSQAELTLDAVSGGGGDIALNGKLSVLPALDMTAAISIENLALPAIQPWAADAASITINNGLFSLQGNIESNTAEPFAYLGDLVLADLDISDSQDNSSLAGVKNLQLQQTKFLLSINELEISSIVIEAPFVRVVVAKGGKTNFASLAADDENNNAAAVDENVGAEIDDSSGDLFVIKIAKTEIRNGSVDFSDFNLPLPFRALISEFGGTVSAFASNSAQPSTLDFDGKVGDYGLATVDGVINLLDPTRQADVDLVFRNVSMPELSPYTVDFAGRKIEQGKLDLDLGYTFADRKMQGDNTVVLNSFVLGDVVESENAMSLPLDLAVALLSDVNGVIDLNMKVSGDLDNPSFSAAGIILKALANLITKAVAAPFKLLGSLIPGLGADEDIGSMQFEAGDAVLLPPEKEKLDNLVTALNQRPELTLKVPAAYVPDYDRPALQRTAADNLVDAELGIDSASPPTELLTRRTRKALEKVARQQVTDIDLKELSTQFEQTNTESAETNFDEVAYMAELRGQIAAAQSVDDAALITLARQRQQTVLDYLHTDKTLPESRALAADTVVAKAKDERWVKFELELDVGEIIPAETATANPEKIAPSDTEVSDKE